jgi:hypothetical protein
MMTDGWYIYPDSREPELKRVRDTANYWNVYYHFKTYGEAWCYLIAKFGRRFDRYNSV